MKKFLETTKAVTLPRGLYIYLERIFRHSFKEAAGREFDGEITDAEIATGLYGLILDREERVGRDPKEMAQILDAWTMLGDVNPESLCDNDKCDKEE